MTTASLRPLLVRQSVPASQLTAPAPDNATLQALLEASLRVPDHGKLEPFRIVLLHDDAKLAFGERLADLIQRNRPDLSDAKREKERRRYEHAPLVVVVIAHVDENSKVPAIEQQLTAGCVAYNLLLGAQALGFGAQWLTGWAAYDSDVARLLGMAANESIVGFVHIGSHSLDVPDRERPRVAELVRTWTP
jgi:nitroreductase